MNNPPEHARVFRASKEALILSGNSIRKFRHRRSSLFSCECVLTKRKPTNFALELLCVNALKAFLAAVLGKRVLKKI